MSIAEWIDATLVTDRSSAGRRLRDTVAWDLIRTTFGCEIIEKLIKREYDILCRCYCSRSSLQFFIEIRTAQFFPQWSYSNFFHRIILSPLNIYKDPRLLLSHVLFSMRICYAWHLLLQVFEDFNFQTTRTLLRWISRWNMQYKC